MLRIGCRADGDTWRYVRSHLRGLLVGSCKNTWIEEMHVKYDTQPASAGDKPLVAVLEELEDALDFGRRPPFADRLAIAAPDRDDVVLTFDAKESGQITSGLQMFGNVTFWIFWRERYRPASPHASARGYQDATLEDFYLAKALVSLPRPPDHPDPRTPNVRPPPSRPPKNSVAATSPPPNSRPMSRPACQERSSRSSRPMAARASRRTRLRARRPGALVW